jgi:hypothetical protein
MKKKGRWVMSRSRRIAMTALALAAGALPVRAAEKLSAGQEFVYTGTLEQRQSQTNMPAVTYHAPVKLSALVTEADPVRGYTVIQMPEIRPQKPPSPADTQPFAEVSVVRYRPDLNRAPGPIPPPRPTLGMPLSPLLMNRPIPFYAYPLGPLADLRVGQSWETIELLMLRGVTSPEVVYTVVGDTKINGRNCVRIEKKPKLPFMKSETGDSSVAVTDYAGSLCVDRETGLTVSDEWRASVLYTAGKLEARVEARAALALKETRQLSAAEVASRIKQAEAFSRVEDAAFGAGPKADHKQQVEAAEQAITRFRRDYPASPFAPALATIAAYLEPEARRLALQGGPAPPFRLSSLAGQEQTLAAYRGKLILLCFFASW